MHFHIPFEILVCAPFSVLVLKAFFPLDFPFFIPDFERQINVANIKDSAVNVIIQRSLGDPEFFLMIHENMAWRLSVADQRRYQFV
jgi:hypothetical protein